MAKIFSLDLGTNSIGYVNRNTDNGNSLENQLEQFGAVVFKKGVGSVKGIEFSYAAERTKNRSVRRLYQARKYRIWETLKVLIDPANKDKKDEEIDLDRGGIYCPLTMRQLNQWRKYDKAKGLKRQYPIDAIKFEQWVRLDFNGDGIADYSSPYELRAELATSQLDFSIEINRFKLGRALYHIAQRRGFKSSKGETLKEQEEATKETIENLEITDTEITALKKSEEKKSKDLSEYQTSNNLKTIGCAFYQLEKEGIRIRGSIYQAVRSQYRKEVEKIFEFQEQLDINSDFFKRIYSDKKDGSIFYKRPLRSQKGLVGKCTLETSKYRCPISHPEFEKFRAFAFINNIQYRNSIDAKWGDLSADQKLRLYNEKFLLTKANFKFQDIREWIEKDIQKKLEWSEKKYERTINYKDKTNVSGCPISGRLKNLLGKGWENWKLETKIEKIRYNKKGEEKKHFLNYSMEDIWHICFSYDDEESIVEFAKTQLNFDDKQTKSLVNLWVAIPQGYSMLSLKTIRNINRFLVPDTNKEGYNGLIYTDAALLAKIPEILGEKLWRENEQLFFSSISDLTQQNREEKRILNIVNSLIANYKTLEYEEQFAYKNTDYKLDSSDLKEIENYTKEAFGAKTWETTENKNEILNDVKEKYQQFFATSKRDYFKLPKLGDTIKQFLSDNFTFLSEKQLDKLYHPSMVEFYKPAKEKQVEYKGIKLSKKLLESPVIGAFKNPMAMRTLHELRRLVNSLLLEGKIDEDTRIVVETARDLNDANMRWAIEAYQREKEAENKSIKEAIKELRGEERDGDDIDKARLLIEQNPDYMFDKVRYDIEKEQEDENKKKKKVSGKTKDFQYKKDVTKYKLWLEQGMRCIYTGKIISISNLFDENATDFEHTIPRSISFDNSLANLTVCDAHYNRHIKKNQIPTQLPNYDKSATINGVEYSAIKPRLQAWEEKVEQLKNNVDFWKQKSKQAQTKDDKDSAIRQRHLWQMELDYWQNKLDRFTMTEVTSGFKSSQLNDTRLITKYAYHYLKSVFSKVEVQKGSITADFRKMLGIQSADEKKNRDKHSHHAIDAAILSCIPVAAKRDRMLELFYKIQENKKLNLPTDYEERELEKEKRSCNIGNISNLNQYIEENILVNHVSKDQTLTPAKRKTRKRGKEVFVKNENGELITKWIQGDSIRGQLHKDSLFGAIKYPVIKDEKLEKDEQGYFVYPKDKDGKEVFLMVMRVPIASFASEKDFEKIIDPNVKKSIQIAVQQRITNGKTFKEAINEPIWLLDKNNQEKKVDKKGKAISPVRHVRCKVAAGKGFFTKDKAIQIKEQTYKSTKKLFHLQDREHKKYYYAQNDGNYLCLLYEFENQKKKQTERKFRLINFFEIAELKLKNADDILNESYFRTIKEKDKNFELKAIIKVGTRILMKKDKEECLQELEPKELNKRLFVVYKFNTTSSDNIYLQNHIEARKDADIKDSYSEFNSTEYQARLQLVANNLNCLIENIDFEINLDGTINFLN